MQLGAKHQNAFPVITEVISRFYFNKTEKDENMEGSEIARRDKWKAVVFLSQLK